MNTDTHYSTTHACQEAGLSYREVDYWIRVGAIAPEVEAQGSGSRRFWTSAQVEWLCAIAEVRIDAEVRGVSLTTVAIADIWATLASGEPWTLTLVTPSSLLPSSPRPS